VIKGAAPCEGWYEQSFYTNDHGVQSHEEVLRVQPSRVSVPGNIAKDGLILWWV
jgi:hypothetical protein